ncbi:hypothetical protein D9611_008894 [Ephemerocybe angulata]|uniref:Nephrocystin 3-like N-terminal domain-containing protein n=1 Tax=Ephemerocybe angulata TaxID=980116 RepID=A0A8H5BYY7_9AGAR|nr:hypothetical protein D9611_008894 [Tulosesus angulatus]
MDFPQPALASQNSQGGSFFHNAQNFTVGNLNQANIGHDQYIIDQQNFIAQQNSVVVTSGNSSKFYIPGDLWCLLDLLNPIPNASHMRNRKLSPPDSNCLPGTRQDVIRKVTSWADASVLRNTNHVMWLYGYVGCGKSAIAQNIAEHYARKKRLAASFFFFRGSGDRSRTVRFAATVANQVAGAIPAASQFIEANARVQMGEGGTESCGNVVRRSMVDEVDKLNLIMTRVQSSLDVLLHPTRDENPERNTWVLLEKVEGLIDEHSYFFSVFTFVKPVDDDQIWSAKHIESK